MTCNNCVRHVRHAAAAVPGVSDVDVDLAGGRATVSFDPASTTPAAIAAAITEAGYESSEATAG
jgi:copper chaperone CopZ